MSRINIAACAATISMFANAAIADMGIDWSGKIDRMLHNPVTEVWQMGRVTNNGLSISHWCASRFGNGYECIDQFVSVNASALQQYNCGGEHWLCAGRSYLFPQGSNAVVPVTLDSYTAQELQAYMELRFDQLGGEITGQTQAIQLSRQLLAGQQQVLTSQQVMMATDTAHNDSLDRIEGKIEVMALSINSAFESVDQRLVVLEQGREDRPLTVPEPATTPAQQNVSVGWVDWLVRLLGMMFLVWFVSYMFVWVWERVTKKTAPARDKRGRFTAQATTIRP